MAFQPQVSGPMLDKLAAVGATALLDSTFIVLAGHSEQAEVVHTDKGAYISSPANDWVLAPFGGG